MRYGRTDNGSVVVGSRLGSVRKSCPVAAKNCNCGELIEDCAYPNCDWSDNN